MSGSKTVKPKNGGHVTNKAIALETLVRKIQWVRRTHQSFTKFPKIKGKLRGKRACTKTKKKVHVF